MTSSSPDKRRSGGEFVRKRFVLTTAEKKRLGKLLQGKELRRETMDIPQPALEWLIPRKVLELVDDVKRERVYSYLDRKIKLRSVLFIGEEGSGLSETELDKQAIEAGDIGVGDRLLIECFFEDKGHKVVLFGSYQDRPEFRNKGVGEEFFTRIFYLMHQLGFSHATGEANKDNLKHFLHFGMKLIKEIKSSKVQKILLAGNEISDYYLYKKL